MYPLNTILIGCADDVCTGVRHELAGLSVVVEAEFADVRACLTYLLAHPGDKRLIVFRLHSAAEIVLLERLNELETGQPILALVDPAHDPSVMIRAMRAGAAQVVRLPLQPEDFAAAMRRIAIQFGHPANQSRMITVLGTVEGSGATTISINLASEIGRLRKSLCLLGEAAIPLGRLANYLNIQPSLTAADLIADLEHLDIERFRRALTPIEPQLQVLAGSYRGIASVRLRGEEVFKLVALGKQLADIIVIDGRYNYEPLDFEFIDQTEQLVLVLTPTIPSLYSAKAVLDLMAHRDCLAQTFVVVNRFVPDSQVFSLNRILEVLGVENVYPVALDVRGVSAAENQGQILRTASPHSPAVAGINALARAVLGMRSEQRSGSWSLLSPLRYIEHMRGTK